MRTGVVSAGFFDMFGVKPLLGRTFVADDDKPGAPAVLVLSYEFWKKQERGDPHIVGKTFQMNDRVHTVIGVLPPIPQYPNENDVYMPLSACPFRCIRALHRQSRRAHDERVRPAEAGRHAGAVPRRPDRGRAPLRARLSEIVSAERRATAWPPLALRDELTARVHARCCWCCWGPRLSCC